jgi:hypothetical protein
MLTIECAGFVILSMLIGFGFNGNNWPSNYIDTVVAGYDKGPIVDLKYLDKSSYCDDSTMGAEHDGTTFEIVAKPYFWEVRSGCVCPGGKYAEAKLEACKPEELTFSCRDIPFFEAAEYDSVDGKILCARRESVLRLTPDRIKPFRDPEDETKWKCPGGQTFCGSHEADHRHISCVPDIYMCPINDISFVDGTDTLILKTDKKDGLALVDLKLSEGGPPCINYETDKNSIT